MKETGERFDQPWFDFKPPRHDKKHAVIVGGGIAGVTTAWALAQRGWQIDLIEQHPVIAQEGSGNPRGILLPRISLKESTESTFYRLAYFEAIRELTRLKKKAPDFTWQQGGVLQLAVNPRILKQIEKLREPDDFVQAVSAKKASEIAGIPIHCKALYFPLAGWLNPGDLCERLIKKARGRIKLHFNTTINHLSFQNAYWQLFDQNNELRLKSEIVVIANASHAIKFRQTNWLALEPARGQISSIISTEKSRDLRCALCYEGYVLPAIEGKHLLGATFIRGDWGSELKASDDRENLEKLEKRLPGVFDYNALEGKGWAGIRAVTPDRMPVVGPVADVDYFTRHYHDLCKGKKESTYPKAQYLKGLYLNTGHGAKGLCSSFLSAALISGQLNNEPLPVSNKIQDILNPSRFIIRELCKKRINVKGECI